MGSNYFPGMISDSGAGGIFSFFVCEGGVLTIDPSVPSGSVHAL